MVLCSRDGWALRWMVLCSRECGAWLRGAGWCPAAGNGARDTDIVAHLGVAARGKSMVAYGRIESEKNFMLVNAEMVSLC